MVLGDADTETLAVSDGVAHDVRVRETLAVADKHGELEAEPVLDALARDERDALLHPVPEGDLEDERLVVGDTDRHAVALGDLEPEVVVEAVVD